MGLLSYIGNAWRRIQRAMPEYRQLNENFDRHLAAESSLPNVVAEHARKVAEYDRVAQDYFSTITDLRTENGDLRSKGRELEIKMREMGARNSELENSLGLEKAARLELEGTCAKVVKERDDARKIVLHYRAQRRGLLERLYAGSAQRNPKAFVVFVDHTDKIASVSERVVKASGYSEKQLIGKDGYSFLVDSSVLKAKLQLSVSPEGERVVSLPRTKFVLPSGKTSSIDLVAERIFEQDSWAKEKYQYVGTWVREETKLERLQRLTEERKGRGYLLSKLAGIRSSLGSIFSSREQT